MNLIPTIIVYISAVLNIDFPYIKELNTIVLIIQPSLNAIFNIIFIDHYKRYCLNLVKRLFNISSGNSMVVPLSSSTR